MSPPLPFKISVLVFIQNHQGKQLLLQRSKAPNKGLWSPIGGKLEMGRGESPFECATRETREEIGLALTSADLHLFGMISEKSYEASGHWLMFLFRCKRPLETLPPPGPEGAFSFFPPEEIDSLAIPETDRKGLWPIYRQYRDRFVVMRADCHPQNGSLEIIVEECQ